MDFGWIVFIIVMIIVKISKQQALENTIDERVRLELAKSKVIPDPKEVRGVFYELPINRKY